MPGPGRQTAGTGAAANQGPTCSGPAPQVLSLGLKTPPKVTGEEAFGGGVKAKPVPRLGEAVALVGKEHVLVVYAGVPQSAHDLLGLGLFHAGVVRPLGY